MDARGTGEATWGEADATREGGRGGTEGEMRASVGVDWSIDFSQYSTTLACSSERARRRVERRGETRRG